MRRRAIAALLGMLVTGCDQVNLVQSVSPPPQAALDQDVEIKIGGMGKCRRLTVDWGDGSSVQDVLDVDLSVDRAVTHRYTGWSGGKTVTVRGVSGCEGTVRTRFTIEPSTWKIGWARNPAGNTATCVPTPGKPALAANSLVTITSPPSPVVKFTSAFDGRKFDADGMPGSSAGPSFPFPGFREYSLVLRVGSSLFQGGTNEQFTVTTGGVLELCQNDATPADNTGGWEVDIDVDQLGPPLP